MTEPLNSPQDGIQSNETPLDGQAQQPQLEVIPKADYVNLQSEYTRTRQAAIEMATELARSNPESIKGIKDWRLQDSVVKNLYGVDTFAQLIAIHWENFASNNEDDENLSKQDVLEREIRLLKYQSQTAQIDQAIKEYKLSHPEIFSVAWSEEKLREELKYISGELSADERVKRASAIAFTPVASPVTNWYKAISPINGGGANVSINGNEVVDANIQKQIAAGRKLLWLPDPK